MAARQHAHINAADVDCIAGLRRRLLSFYPPPYARPLICNASVFCQLHAERAACVTSLRVVRARCYPMISPEFAAFDISPRAAPEGLMRFSRQPCAQQYRKSDSAARNRNGPRNAGHLAQRFMSPHLLNDQTNIND